MNAVPPSVPPTLGLFEKRIEGDDSLMELARRRFRQAGMGTEIYAASSEMLEWALRFRPADDWPTVAHLSRGANLMDRSRHPAIEQFARHFAGQVFGLVIHDDFTLATNPGLYVRAAQEMNSRLHGIANGPRLFIEYAVGVEPAAFVKFFAAIHSLDRISACLDIGHLGIQAVRKAYARKYPGHDICQLKSQPALLPQAMPDVAEAVADALPAVLFCIRQLGEIGKPAHFHLHDGHPLSTFSPFGIADHLSFLAEIPLSFEYRGRHSAGLMFGSDGLSQIVTEALNAFGKTPLSFTLEIHPTMDRRPLGDAAELFSHWRDQANAEKMNAWLAALAANHRLLREAICRATENKLPPAGEAAGQSL
jgi:hypothetical protein